jgi:hypothetical protein
MLYEKNNLIKRSTHYAEIMLYISDKNSYSSEVEYYGYYIEEESERNLKSEYMI